MAFSRRSFLGALAAAIAARVAFLRPRPDPETDICLASYQCARQALGEPRVYFSEIHDPQAWPAPHAIVRIWRYDLYLVEFRSGRTLRTGDPVALTPSGRAVRVRRPTDLPIGLAANDANGRRVLVFMSAPVARV